MFRDRKDAGERLAEKMSGYRNREDALVFALPRGGLVVGYEVARILKVPLDVFIVRKIGFPREPELAIGAVSETGTVALNREMLSVHSISREYIDAEVARQNDEIRRRVDLYRGGRSMALEGKTVLLVDDGVATGATVKAAIEALHREKIKKLVIALPVAPPEIAADLAGMADEFICLETPANFMAVGMHYQHFGQVSDEEVTDLLRRSWSKAA